MFSVPLCYCLSAANRTVHVGSTVRYPDVRYSRFRGKFHWWRDPSQLLESARTLAAKQRIGVIMACSDDGIRFLAEHRRELETVAPVAGTPSLESFDTAIDKAAFAEFLLRAALPHPETVALRPERGLPRLPPFPAVLKPARGSGGMLIRYFEREDEFRGWVASGGLGTRAWVIQSYVRGKDIGCSVLCRAGKILAYTIQTSIEPARISFSPPGAIQFFHDEEVFALCGRLVAALKWTGVANIDMVRDRDGKLFLLELNGRYWATMMGSYRAGVNFPELACLDAIGRQIPRVPYRDIRFIRGSSTLGWREIRLAETTLLWRLSDPGPVIAEWRRSLWRAD